MTNLLENAARISFEILVVDQMENKRQKLLVDDEIDVDPTFSRFIVWLFGWLFGWLVWIKEDKERQ